MVDRNIRSFVYVNPSLLVGPVVLLVLMGVLMTKVILAEKIKCSSFKTQAEAQAHYRPSLDRDGDGIACESLLPYHERN